MASINHIAATPSPEIQDRLFIIANYLALKYAQEYSSSTWHSWDVVDQARIVMLKNSEGPNHHAEADDIDGHDEHELELPPNDRFFWHKTGRFASCLGVSTRIVNSLQFALGSDPDPNVSRYANAVYLLTSAQHATSELDYHAVAAMCFDTFAIVIDHALNPVAMEIPIDSEFYAPPYISMSGYEGMERLNYFREQGEYKLTMDHAIYDKYPPIYFSETDPDAAVAQLAIPAALEALPLKDQEHILVPPVKHIDVRSLLNEEPKLIASEYVDGKYLATTLRVQVDFANPSLTIQVPFADWAAKHQGDDWDIRFIHLLAGMQSVNTAATVCLTVDLDAKRVKMPSVVETRQLAFLWVLVEEFGLGSEVLMWVVDSVYRVWAPYRLYRVDSVLEGEDVD
jgi:hypothetical protein